MALAVALGALRLQCACAASAAPDVIVMPTPTNAVQFRLHTNGSPSAPHLFNTFEIEAYGEFLLKSPDARNLDRNVALHNILVDGAGPRSDASNGMSIVERATGPGWTYVALDVTGAYRGRLKQYKRGILFVEPGLFVLYDHLVAEKPSGFMMQLHSPAATQLDPVWGDLRLESTNAGIRIHAPSQRHDPRFWARMEPGSLLPGTVGMQLGPTNKLAALDLLTVFAIHKKGQTQDCTFKLLQSHTAVGARINRDGFPTLVAFRNDPAESNPSLTGFPFSGPVGVDVFKPKRNPGIR